jgi:hypothetical protein
MTQKHTSSPISPFFQLEKWGWKAWQAAAWVESAKPGAIKSSHEKPMLSLVRTAGSKGPIADM